jgi:AraC family transcriptional regulator
MEEVAAEMVTGDPSTLEIPPVILESDPSLKLLLDAVAFALDRDDTATAVYSDFLARTIAAQLIRTYASGRVHNRQVPGSRGRVSQSVAEAVDYMRTHLDQPLGLEEIAAAVNRSPSHFARLFGADLGMPPHRYLINLRVERAQHLLERTSRSIAQIAFECGFSHQEHLTRSFKRYHGTTPAAYRKSKRN